MSESDEKKDLDWVEELTEALYDSLWQEHVLHFSPGENIALAQESLLNEEELEQLAASYDIAMAEDGENITWEEYLREQSELARD